MSKLAKNFHLFSTFIITCKIFMLYYFFFVCSSYDFDPEQFAGSSSIPILVIGTKLDLAQSVREHTHQRASSIADECGADEINLVSQKWSGHLVNHGHY